MQLHGLLAALLAVSFTAVANEQEECTLRDFMNLGLDCASQLIDDGNIDLNEIGRLIRLDVYPFLGEIGINVTNPLKQSDACLQQCSTDPSTAQNDCDCVKADEFKAMMFISDMDNYNFVNVALEGFQNGNISGLILVNLAAKYEPMIAYMVGSIYKRFMKGNDRKIVIPDVDFDIYDYIGDLTGVDTAYLTGLNSYCSNIGAPLTTCLEAGVRQQCGDYSWDSVWKDYLSLFGTRYCSGSSVKDSVKTTLASNMDSLFREIECMLTDDTTKFELDFDHVENLFAHFGTLGYALQPCNLDLALRGAIKPIENWVSDVVVPIINTSDILSLNLNPLISILDNDGALDQTISNLEKIMQCIMPNIEAFEDEICLTGDPLDIGDKFKQIITVISTAFPFEPLTDLKNLDIWGKTAPSSSLGPERSTVMMINGHIYRNGVYSKTCSLHLPDVYSQVIFEGHGLRFRLETQSYNGIRSLRVVRTESGPISFDTLTYSDTGGQLLRQTREQSGFFNIGGNLPPLHKTATAVCDGLLSGSTYYIQHTKYESCTIEDPFTGSLIGVNTIRTEDGFDVSIVLRASDALLDRAKGMLIGDCVMGVDTYYDDEFTTTSRAACDFCAQYQTDLQKPCEYACNSTYDTQWLENMLNETLSMAESFNQAESDRRLYYSSINRNGADTYRPCSIEGWLKNAALPCASLYPNIYYNTFANITSMGGMKEGEFADFIKELGNIEPYIIYAISSFINKFGNSEDTFYNFGTIGDYTMDAFVTDALENHCSSISPISKCIADEMDNMVCEDEAPDIIADLRSRYCTNLDSTPAVKTSVKTSMASDFGSFADIASCITVRGATDGTFAFNETKLDIIYNAGLDRCEMEQFTNFILTLYEESSEVNLVTVLERIKPVVVPPMTCMYNILKDACNEGGTFDADVTRLIPHLNTMTGGLLDLKTSDFIRAAPNPASTTRVSMWVIGDPHIRRVGATSFTTCESRGLTTFYRNDFVRFTGYNEPTCDTCEATYLKNFTIEFFNISNPDDFTAKATYFTEGEDPSQTFTNGEVDIQTGINSVALEYKAPTKTVIITDANSGTMFAIRPWKYMYNVVVRASESVAESSQGLLVSGCDLSATIIAQKRRKRATNDECVIACAGAPDIMREQCVYDCDILDDPDVGTGNYETIEEVEEEVVVKDADVIDFIPDAYTVYESPVTPAGAGTKIRASLALCSLLLAALALLM